MTNNIFYSLTVNWNDNDPDEGTFSWAGWATSQEAALNNTYASMSGDSDDDKIKTYGSIIEIFEGAYIWQAPEATRLLLEALHTEPSRGSFTNLVEHYKRAIRSSLDFLCPGYEDQETFSVAKPSDLRTDHEDIEEKDAFINHYQCPKCGTKWVDPSASQNDDRCPECECSTSPYLSTDVE